MVYVVSKYFIIGGMANFEGYVRVFRDLSKAMDYAIRQTIASGSSDYFHVESLPADTVYTEEFAKLINP